MNILLATGNKNKLTELLGILPPSSARGSVFNYLSFADFPNIPEPQETAPDLKGNAIIKAMAGFKATGLISIADDTGLMVDALCGRPGVYSARYSGPDGNYATNNIKLLAELAGIKHRTARFCTMAALVLPDGQIITEEGTLEGTISQDYNGANGFGYDPLFIVSALNKTMAQLTMQEKNQISHRAQAFKKIAQHLKTLS